MTDADASGETVFAALDEVLEEQPDTPAAHVAPTAALPDSFTAIGSNMLAELQAIARQCAEPRAEQERTRRDGIVAAALSEGRIAPAPRDAARAARHRRGRDHRVPRHAAEERGGAHHGGRTYRHRPQRRELALRRHIRQEGGLIMVDPRSRIAFSLAWQWRGHARSKSSNSPVPIGAQLCTRLPTSEPGMPVPVS